MPDRLSLVADVGGTNTRVALARGPVLEHDSIRRFHNRDFAGLEDVLRSFLEASGAAPEAACTALAGPVRNGCGQMTNLDWKIDRATLAHTTGARDVNVINDLQAQGYALGALPGDSLSPILPGKPDPDAPRLVVGIGTGFNIAAVYSIGGTRHVTVSETGHMSLPAASPRDLELIHHLAQGPRAEIEAALSGPGLSALYGWIAGDTAPPEGPAILQAAAQGAPQAAETLHLFLRLLGTVVGDLALSYLPFGGLYLAGGVARAVAPYLHSHGFAQAFSDKGRFSDFMADFPLSVIQDDYAALLGCASHLAEDCRR